MNPIEKILKAQRTNDPSRLAYDELLNENTQLDATLVRMAALLAQHRLELDKLRRTVRRSRPGYSWIAEKAQLDAKGLYTMQCAGMQPSRRNAEEVLFMARRRWQWARRLAMMAGVHDGEVFVDVDPQTIIQKLKGATAYAAENPQIFREFSAYGYAGNGGVAGYAGNSGAE